MGRKKDFKRWSELLKFFLDHEGELTVGDAAKASGYSPKTVDGYLRELSRIKQMHGPEQLRKLADQAAAEAESGRRHVER